MISLSGRINRSNYRGLYRFGYQNATGGHVNGLAALTGFFLQEIAVRRDRKRVAVITT